MIPKKRKEKLLLLLLLEEERKAIIAPSKQLAPSKQIYFLLSINLLSGQWLPPYFEAFFFFIFLFGKQWLTPCFEAFVLETMTFLDLSFIHAFSFDCLTFSYGKFVSTIPLRNFAMIQT